MVMYDEGILMIIAFVYLITYSFIKLCYFHSKITCCV